jgi:hypothetical protein
VTAEEDAGRSVLRREITTFREVSPGAYRRDGETHRQRLLAPAEVESWLREAGFEVRVAGAYRQTRLPAGLTAYWARKPRR